MSHRVVLVREWDAQMSSSGCCGRLGGVNHELGEECTYAHVRADMETMGALYMALRDMLPDSVEISVVDPRNQIWLVPAIWRDARRRGMTPGQAWRQVRRGVSQGAVIVDGCTVSSGGMPDIDEAADAVLAELGASAAQP